MLPTISVKHLRLPGGEEPSNNVTTLKEVCAGKVGVIDLWHTKCTRCPAALGHFNELAAEFDSSKVIFLACALSQGSGNEEDVADFINEWENIHHIFVDESDKESLKAELGYSAVPFYVVFDQSGKVIASGDKSFDYEAEVRKALSTGLTFDEDF